jgi:hypothetical protein
MNFKLEKKIEIKSLEACWSWLSWSKLEYITSESAAWMKRLAAAHLPTKPT